MAEDAPVFHGFFREGISQRRDQTADKLGGLSLKCSGLFFVAFAVGLNDGADHAGAGGSAVIRSAFKSGAEKQFERARTASDGAAAACNRQLTDGTGAELTAAVEHRDRRGGAVGLQRSELQFVVAENPAARIRYHAR